MEDIVTTQVLKIDGMSCAHCVKAVTLALQHVPGVGVKQVSVGHAEVVIDESVVTSTQLSEAVGEAGYTLVSTAPTGRA